MDYDEGGNQHSYLGMQIELNDGYMTIDMSGYVNKVLQEYGDVTVKLVPGKKGMFLVDMETRPLSEVERKLFH